MKTIILKPITDTQGRYIVLITLYKREPRHPGHKHLGIVAELLHGFWPPGTTAIVQSVIQPVTQKKHLMGDFNSAMLLSADCYDGLISPLNVIAARH